MNFLIGFEFEFGWLPVEKTQKPRIDKISYFEQHVFGHVKDHLKSYFKQKYKFISLITDDPSITFSKNFRDGNFGVEVVTKPMPEKDAISFLREFLIWMKKNPYVVTNETCGLHVNISCADSAINKKLDYYSILENTPQDEILEQFSRTNNTYCKSTKTKKFSFEVEHRKTKPQSLEFWLSRTNKNYITVLTSDYINLKLDDNKEKDIIYFKTQKDAKKMIKNAFLTSLFKIDKNIAIVEKRSPSKKRYFEFRMIGNTDYELRIKDILSCISQFKSAIKKSVS